MKRIYRNIIAFICAIALVATSITGFGPTTVSAEGTVSDIVLTKAIKNFGEASGYVYGGEVSLTNATSDYKYMVITYVGSISRYRFTIQYEEGYSGATGPYWINPSEGGSESKATLANKNAIFESATESTIVVDIEASGIDLDKAVKMHIHYGPGTLNVTNCVLTATKPEEEETTEEPAAGDIVLTNTIGTYGTSSDSGYAYKDATFTGATSEHRYMVISYVGNITRCRLGFYDKTNAKIGTEMWVDPVQSSSDLVLVGNNPVFKSETGAMVVVDIQASGFDAGDLRRIRVHNNNRALQITDCRLTKTAPEIPVDDMTVVENYISNDVSLQQATSDYKYMIFTYVGDISQLQIQGIKDGDKVGDIYCMDQTQPIHFSLVGDSPVLDSEEVATVVVDIEASGIDLDGWDAMHMYYDSEKLAIGNIRISESEEVKDADVFRYFKDKEPVENYAYSFAVVGDTQIISLNDKRNGTNYLGGIYDWILDNKEDKNIQYVFGLGDVVETPVVEEWEHAQEQIAKLDGQIPYSLTRGNHDISGVFFNPEDDTDYFSQYLGTEAYKSQFANGGFYQEDNIFNVWHTFTVGEINYLMLALDYAPSDDVLAWASDVVESHPYHNVIISTHMFLDSDGTKSLETPGTFGGYNDGEKMWNKFVSQHKNIVLVMCGHVSSDKIVVSKDTGVNGNVVTSMLIDPQDVDKTEGSAGMVAMLYFSEDGKNVQVEYYSTVRERFFLEENQFSLELPVVEEPDEEPITPEPPKPEKPSPPEELKPGEPSISETTENNATAPGRTSVTSATRKKNSKIVKLSIKKVKGAKGYRVQFSKTKKFTKKNIILTKDVKNRKVNVNNKKFKKAKKIYVRVKAYKMNGKKKVFAKKWSVAKLVKIKK